MGYMVYANLTLPQDTYLRFNASPSASERVTRLLGYGHSEFWAPVLVFRNNNAYVYVDLPSYLEAPEGWERLQEPSHGLTFTSGLSRYYLGIYVRLPGDDFATKGITEAELFARIKDDLGVEVKAF